MWSEILNENIYENNQRETFDLIDDKNLKNNDCDKNLEVVV